ncbi:hypothetical protein BU26DRAFT_559269 [Trematosphaeria pertusa]|uniref:RRM domain-containing protein n=1 Tax=Trematosphaeria pertusa TaxID=390896 RepID=A0A6A6IVK4_9PLEO|nr:uncharacterized protein BU26DRAFT_559269 [Trematosphaeria pertusa]KAF2254595.1 hypothetical protein BU26DRAFT_559269 [Trematosphaeria pertusa]
MSTLGKFDFMVIYGEVEGGRVLPWLDEWANLKDNVRNILAKAGRPGQPGRAETAITVLGRRVGTCEVPAKEDVKAIYSMLIPSAALCMLILRSSGLVSNSDPRSANGSKLPHTSSPDVSFHVFERDQRLNMFVYWHCNCSDLYPSVPKGTHDLLRTGLTTNGDIALPSAQSVQYQSVPSAQYQPAQSAQYRPAQSAQYQPVPSAQYPLAQPPGPVYWQNQSGRPANVSGGAVVTQATKILLLNLPPDMSASDRRYILGEIKPLVPTKFDRLQLEADYDGKMYMLFDSQREAECAAEAINGKPIRGYKIKAHLDKDDVGEIPPPLIARDSFPLDKDEVGEIPPPVARGSW